MSIEVTAQINAPLEVVWKAYTTPEDIVKWNAASDDWHTTRAEVDLKVGGQFLSRMEAKDGSFGFDFSGIYTNIIEPSLIEYEFGGRKAKVQFTAESSGTIVSVKFDPEQEHSIEMQQQGWQAILNNFKRFVEHP